VRFERVLVEPHAVGDERVFRDAALARLGHDVTPVRRHGGAQKHAERPSHRGVVDAVLAPYLELEFLLERAARLGRKRVEVRREVRVLARVQVDAEHLFLRESVQRRGVRAVHAHQERHRRRAHLQERVRQEGQKDVLPLERRDERRRGVRGARHGAGVDA
jgi:hypothetical protein